MFSAATVLAASFGIALGGLFLSHIWLATQNRTTIEANYRGSNPYNVGALRNAEQILGVFDITWLLPIPPTDLVTDGLSYPVKESFKATRVATTDPDLESQTIGQAIEE